MADDFRFVGKLCSPEKCRQNLRRQKYIIHLAMPWHVARMRNTGSCNGTACATFVLFVVHPFNYVFSQLVYVWPEAVLWRV